MPSGDLPERADLPESDDVGQGHNHPPEAAQWQTPHLPDGTKVEVTDRAEPDRDLVEDSFVEGFSAASDPTSFLRLAGVAFTGVDGEGKTLSLLRVNLDQTTDMSAITPHIGGKTYRYDPLPAKLVSKRRKLRFVYHDGEVLRELSFFEARGLTEVDGDASSKS